MQQWLEERQINMKIIWFKLHTFTNHFILKFSRRNMQVLNINLTISVFLLILC